MNQAHALTLGPAEPRSAASCVAVSGGKGGVGKTLLATNLAILAARAGYKTLLVDLDPGLANVDVHLRLPARRTLEDLAQNRCPVRDALIPGPGGIDVLAGRSGSLWLAGSAEGAIRKALAAVARASHGYDLVICDTGAGIGPLVIETLLRARLVLAVTTPDPASATDTYALCKVLQQKGRALPSLAVNRARTRDDALRTAARLSAVCEKFLSRKPPWLGYVRSSSELERSVLEQRPFVLQGTGTALEDLRALCAATLSALPGLTRTARPQAANEASAPR